MIPLPSIYDTRSLFDGFFAVRGNGYLFAQLDPRSKFFFFLSMAVVTSAVRSGPALLLLFVLFVAVWAWAASANILLLLLGKMKVLILFIFLLWFVLGIFSVDGGTPLWSGSFPARAGQTVHMSLEWFDLYKGAVLALRIYLMISCFYTVIISTNFSDIIWG
jgi:energy-coupling factor transport system permease protein